MNENTKVLLKTIALPIVSFLLLFLVSWIIISFDPAYTGGIIPLMLGTTFYLVYFAIDRLGNRKKEQCTYLTTGVIVSKEIDRNSDYYGEYPIYQYSYGGQEYTVRSNVSDSRKKTRIGQEVNIFLDPENPENSYIESYDQTLSLIGKIFKWIGMVLIFIGIFVTLGIVIF